MKADIESKCPATGTNIKLTVSPEKIESLEPEDAAISLVIPSAADACSSIRNSFCMKYFL
jgi:alkylmercury lyase